MSRVERDGSNSLWRDHKPAAGCVFVTHTAAPGGGDLALARYLSGSSISGHQLISIEDGPIWDSPRDAGVTVEILPVGRAGYFSALLALRRALVESRKSTVVANSMRAALMVALVRPRGIRFVYWVRDGLTAGGISLAGRVLTRFVTLRAADLCIANSNWTAASIRECRATVPTVVLTSPSGITLDPNTSGEADVVTPDSAVRLLYLGRIAPWKGVHVAINAVALINAENPSLRYTLDIAGAVWFGEDEYLKDLQHRAEMLDFVRFLGHVQDVPGLLRSYDGLLHCSVVAEPFGQVIVQGMSAGLAVFATQGGGPSEIITDGSDGFLVPAADEQSLASAILEAFADSSRLRQIRTEAQRTSRMYSDEILIQKIDEKLTTVLAGQE